MADFTSSLYLGMRHASAELPPWSALTTGRPSALGRPIVAEAVATLLAGLQGADRAMLVRSTLHAFSDCLDVLAGTGSALVVDAALYPVARWAVQRAAGLGVPVASVAHHDLGGLRRVLDGLRRRGLRPVVVADGICGGCARPYPLEEAARRTRAHGGVLVIDDTQALGLFGGSGGGPFGHGGGGSVRRAGITFHDIVAVASLAKAFGAPVASVAGPAEIIRRVERLGGSNQHSSPPSIVDVAAAARALERNAADGDRLRCRLAIRVRLLRRRCAEQGLHLAGGLFPVQATPEVGVETGLRLLDRLASHDLRAVLRRDCAGGSAVALALTATHRCADVAAAADILAAAWFADRPRGAK
ncbi:aminotransferase class I/II-fold pyridoxal phosphate-dependent enzyme [Pseudonocardia cypriaca]|uniref:8-amino-7-oxononanoate synthase n=1 Tax=Pseudonocardia cypriaca TaxID=882449 RepID=A0A543FSN8_9PSEU|nr:aminotransferase class I/II-fold pyridoxal phosphate-dependent enzyme [Pseudonocardia cypriaca]TQM36850.1 8-amino-7-oxononanoate synthase [Pseudonocardia cypriaca]